MKLALGLALPSSLVVLALTGVFMSCASRALSEVSTKQEANASAPLASSAPSMSQANAKAAVPPPLQATVLASGQDGADAKAVALHVGGTLERAVFDIEVVNHLTSKRVTLEESARFLRPFGRLALAEYMLELGGPMLGRQLAPLYPS